LEVTNIPWYLSWPFWTIIAGLIPTVLSQVPPIRVWFKKAKIDLDIYSKIAITHKVGNPNLQLHLIVSNTGGRKIRIKNIEATIYKDQTELINLPVQNYLQNQSDKETLLFTRFLLKPDEELGHIINLFKLFNKEQEDKYNKAEKNSLADFRIKKESISEDQKEPVELDSKVINPFHVFFEDHFLWKAGEYEMTVTITTDRTEADFTKKYRFTIFESHEEQLKEITKHYKFGGGIWWNPNIQTSVILELKDSLQK
jgi:hypothetical protein